MHDTHDQLVWNASLQGDRYSLQRAVRREGRDRATQIGAGKCETEGTGPHYAIHMDRQIDSQAGRQLISSEADYATLCLRGSGSVCLSLCLHPLHLSLCLCIVWHSVHVYTVARQSLTSSWTSGRDHVTQSCLGPAKQSTGRSSTAPADPSAILTARPASKRLACDGTVCGGGWRSSCRVFARKCHRNVKKAARAVPAFQRARVRARGRY